MSKINWKAKLEHEFIGNYKILQQAFTKIGITKHIDVEKLIKGKYQDNLEFLQWMKRYFDKHHCGAAYDAVGKRRNQELEILNSNNSPTNRVKDISVKKKENKGTFSKKNEEKLVNKNSVKFESKQTKHNDVLNISPKRNDNIYTLKENNCNENQIKPKNQMNLQAIDNGGSTNFENISPIVSNDQSGALQQQSNFFSSSGANIFQERNIYNKKEMIK